MKLKIDKSFVKDTNKIKDTKVLQRVAVCIETSRNLKDFGKLQQQDSGKNKKFFDRLVYTF